MDPAWGRSRIAYEAPGDGLWTANPDGSDPVLVSKSGGDPAWSPSGVLAYIDGGRLVVGSNAPVKLPFWSVEGLGWTADGTRLVLGASKTRFGLTDLYSIKPDGTDPVRLTKNYGVS